jgi:hypothetical protein
LASVDPDKSVSYDARQQYHPLFIKLMGAAREASIRGDWSVAYRCYREVYGMARPFLNGVECEAIDKLRHEAESKDNSLGVVQLKFRQSIMTQLREIVLRFDDAIMKAAKDHGLLLPVGSMIDEEPDWDAIRKRGSV